jgi:predicted RNA methylase
VNELIPRATVEEMVAHHDKSIELFRHAFGKIEEASDAIKAAYKEQQPFGADVYLDSNHREVREFKDAVQLPDADRYMHVASRLASIKFWTWITEKGDLQRLMDKEAREQLHKQLAYVPLRSRDGRSIIDEAEMAKSFPPVTVDNVLATIEQFMLDAETIFRRGVANAFSQLDRRFRSHDGFKIGSRLILDRIVTVEPKWNSWSLSYGHYKLATLQDIERAFAVLDEQCGSSFRNCEWAIRQEIDRDRGSPHQFEVQTAYFKIRVFKNGNAHLWMARDDLVDKVNRLLAEYYGEVVGDAQTRDDPLRHKSGPLAVRDFDLFPTPDAVAEKVIKAANLNPYRRDSEPPAETLRVLEPSAGLGNLAMRAVAAGCHVDVVEIHQGRAEALRGLDGICGVYVGDFLKLNPCDGCGLYDRVIMNPPFTGERDVQHVYHALKFLKPGGRLVAVMGAGVEFRETPRTVAFRAHIEAVMGERIDHSQWGRGTFQDLPERSFAEAGTNINTVLICVDVKESIVDSELEAA